MFHISFFNVCDNDLVLLNISRVEGGFVMPVWFQVERTSIRSETSFAQDFSLEGTIPTIAKRASMIM